ncbi:hypothetical protein Tco_0712361 [Tanacetum coccineum]
MALLCMGQESSIRELEGKVIIEEHTNWNQGSSTKAVKIEDASKKAMCAIDGAGFDWSDMARRDSGNMLYAFSDSEVFKNSKNLGLKICPPRDSSLKPTTGCDKESENSKENTDDSLEQHQMTDTETCSFESPLKNNDAPIIEDWVSDDEDEVETPVVVKKKTVIPTAAKIEKPVRKPVKYAEM